MKYFGVCEYTPDIIQILVGFGMIETLPKRP